jgi:hypothetical protein
VWDGNHAARLVLDDGTAAIQKRASFRVTRSASISRRRRVNGFFAEVRTPSASSSYRRKPIFVELKSRRGVASNVQKQIRLRTNALQQPGC